jgi:putative lipoprotein
VDEPGVIDAKCSAKESPMRELVVPSVLIMAMTVMACQSGREWKPSSKAKISGSISYVQKVALPPNATVELRLEDVSRPDAPPILVAEKKVATQGRQQPIPFQLEYDSTRIQPTHHYAVRASIVSDGAKIFATGSGYPVITGGNPVQIAVLVEPIGNASRKDATSGPTPPLVGTYWKAVEIDGTPIATMADSTREVHLCLRTQDKRVDGDGGVNLITGSYELKDQTLRFSDLASTLMAGPTLLMTQERSFYDALKATKGYRISGKSLELIGGQKVVARLEASEPP